MQPLFVRATLVVMFAPARLSLINKKEPEMKRTLECGALFIAAMCFPAMSLAGVDKVYSPRIHAGDMELELRGTYVDSDGSPEDNVRQDKLSLGYAFSDRVSLEAYLNGEKVPGESYELEAYELEGRFNLFQNTQSAFGLLLEVEKEREEDVWELKLGPLYEQNLGEAFRLKANAFVSEEHGADADDSDAEYSGALQFAYMADEEFQPAFEYYGERNNHGVGPVLLGELELGEFELEWEAGVIFGITDNSDDATYRWQIEYEF